jgi:hypothetical protein
MIVFIHGLTNNVPFWGTFLEDDDTFVGTTFPPRRPGLALEGGGVVAPLLAMAVVDEAVAVSSPLVTAAATTFEGGVRWWSPCLSTRGDRLEDGEGRAGMVVGTIAV